MIDNSCGDNVDNCWNSAWSNLRKVTLGADHQDFCLEQLRCTFEALCDALQKEDVSSLLSIFNVRLPPEHADTALRTISFWDAVWLLEDSSQLSVPQEFCQQLLFELLEDEGLSESRFCYPFKHHVRDPLEADDPADLQDKLDLKRKLAAIYLIKIVDTKIETVNMLANLPPGRINLLRKRHDDDLYLAMIQASDLWKTDNMPKHNVCSLAITCSNELQQERVVELFISHAWRNLAHPDADGRDWRTIQNLAQHMVEGAFLLHKLLHKLECETTALPDDGSCSDIFLGNIQLSYKLINEIYQLIQEATSKLSRETDKAIIAFVLDRIHLWIDWTCLPQKPRTEEQMIWFQTSLRKLDVVQGRMHTVALGQDNGYLDRAWCVAELANSRNATTFGFKSFSHDDFRSDAFRTMMCTDALLPSDVLESLQLRITNANEDAEAVCRILWLEPSKHFLFFDSVGFLFRSKEAPRSFRVKGLRSHVLAYLGQIGSSSRRNNLLDFNWWLEWRSRFSQKQEAVQEFPCKTLCFLMEGNQSLHAVFEAFCGAIMSLTTSDDHVLECNFEEIDPHAWGMKQAKRPDALVIAADESPWSRDVDHVVKLKRGIDLDGLKREVDAMQQELTNTNN